MLQASSCPFVIFLPHIFFSSPHLQATTDLLLSGYTGVSVYLGCDNKIPEAGKLIQQKFMPHSSGSWRSEIRVQVSLGTGCLPAGSFNRTLISLMTQSSMKGPPPSSNTLGIKFTTYEFGEHTTFRP